MLEGKRQIRLSLMILSIVDRIRVRIFKSIVKYSHSPLRNIKEFKTNRQSPSNFLGNINSLIIIIILHIGIEVLTMEITLIGDMSIVNKMVREVGHEFKGYRIRHLFDDSCLHFPGVCFSLSTHNNRWFVELTFYVSSYILGIESKVSIIHMGIHFHLLFVLGLVREGK